MKDSFKKKGETHVRIARRGTQPCPLFHSTPPVGKIPTHDINKCSWHAVHFAAIIQRRAGTCRPKPKHIPQLDKYQYNLSSLHNIQTHPKHQEMLEQSDRRRPPPLRMGGSAIRLESSIRPSRKRWKMYWAMTIRRLRLANTTQPLPSERRPTLRSRRHCRCPRA